jgi:hypothetical protein
LAEVRLEGVEEMKARLLRLAAEAPKEVGRALYEEAKIEEKESRERTPVLTGALRASHETSKPRIDRDISVTIRVGGPSAPYALPVHENLDAFHKVGQAKFLESTLLESAPYMAQRIAKRIDLNRAAR